MTKEMAEPIAKRVFETVDTLGKLDTLVLMIGKPYQVEESATSLSWRCPIQVAKQGTLRYREALGSDGIDALQVGLILAEQEILSIARLEQLTVSWLDKGELGLSVPNAEANSSVSSPVATDHESAVEDLFNKYFDDMDTDKET